MTVTQANLSIPINDVRGSTMQIERPAGIWSKTATGIHSEGEGMGTEDRVSAI